MAALFNTSLISSAFTGLPPRENNVYIYDNLFPLIEYVGSGKLFVDNIQYSGRLTYSPDAENIADNGQFMVGGGHQGRSIDCEISRVRLWSQALSEEQLSALQSCDVLDVERFIGGQWPHALHASWEFNGNFTNGFGPLENLTEQSVWEEQTGTGFNSADQMNYPYLGLMNCFAKSESLRYWKNILTGQVGQERQAMIMRRLSKASPKAWRII